MLLDLVSTSCRNNRGFGNRTENFLINFYTAKYINSFAEAIWMPEISWKVDNSRFNGRWTIKSIVLCRVYLVERGILFFNDYLSGYFKAESLYAMYVSKVCNVCN